MSTHLAISIAAVWILPLHNLSVLCVSCGYLASLITVVLDGMARLSQMNLKPLDLTARDAENAEVAQRVETAPALAIKVR